MSNHRHPALLSPEHPDAPKYWMHETSGVLARAVEAYLTGKKLDKEQIKLLQASLHQWVQSPVWTPSGSLEVLRLRVAAIECFWDLHRAIEAAVELNMDPL